MGLLDALLPKSYKNARTLYEEDLDNWREKTESLLNTINLNLAQVGKDTFGGGYEYNNDGAQSESTTINQYITNIIDGTTPIDGTSSDTFTINSDGHAAVLSSAGLSADRTLTFPDASGRLQTKVLFSGSVETLDVNNYCNILWKNPYASPTVNLTLVGGHFDPAHYTEMRQHLHAESAQHKHDIGHAHSDDFSITADEGAHVFTVESTDGDHAHSGSTDATGWMTLTHETNGGAVGRAEGHNASYGVGQTGLVVENWGLTIPAQTFSTAAGGGHNHAVTGDGKHNHTVAGSVTDLVGDSQLASIAIANTGTTTATALTAAEKTYADTLLIFIDGVDKTAEALVLAEANFTGEFTAFGDETAGHHLNTWTLTSPGPGTGEMDISSLVTTAAFHRIEIRQAGTAGGKLNWFLEVF